MSDRLHRDLLVFPNGRLARFSVVPGFIPSTMAAIQRYLQNKIETEQGLEQRTRLERIQRELRPEHLTNPPPGTWNEGTIDRVIAAKMDQVLERYKNDLLEMILKTTCEEIFDEPLVESVAGRPVEIRMRGVAKDQSIRYSAFAVIQRYLRIKIAEEKDEMRRQHLERIQRDLRPEHMANAPLRTWDEEVMTRAVVAKGTQILSGPRYNGNLARFIQEVSCRETRSPLIEEVAGREVSVSMSSVREYLTGGARHFLETYALSALSGAEQKRALQLIEQRFGVSG